MYAFDSIVLYVEDIAVSAKFYAELLGASPEVLSPTFMSFELTPTMKLELKERSASKPAATVTGGGTELCMTVSDAASLNELFDLWRDRGYEFAQTPTTLVFGLTFVAQDPDGHRIRVSAQN